MDFDLSEEQRMLRDSVDRLMSQRYAHEQRRTYGSSDPGWSTQLWAQYAEMGLLALPFPGEDGGMGGTAVETMIVMESFGRALVLEPYLTTVVVCGEILRLGARADRRSDTVGEICQGGLVVALAHTEPGTRYALEDVEGRATRSGEGWVLDGTKSVVLLGNAADKFIVSARTAGAMGDREGISLFLVDAAAAGVSRVTYETQDNRRGAELTLCDVRVASADLLGEAGAGFTLLEQAVQRGIAALAAESVGAMAGALDMTVDYLKTRRQFGVSIGSFQALQHRAAEMLVAVEQARSMAMYAAMMVDHAGVNERRKAISAVKAQVGRCARFVSQQAIQLHGGIGMTDEYRVGHYFKRLAMNEVLFGDTDHHTDTVALLGGL